MKIGSPNGIFSITLSTALLELGRRVSSTALRENLNWICMSYVSPRLEWTTRLLLSSLPDFLVSVLVMSLIQAYIKRYFIEKCIALMEDIDAAFSHTINRETNNSKKDGDKDKDKDKDKEKEPSMFAQAPRTSGITLSGLLNALDGVGAQEGRILFATTNKYHSLDPALCRPGRMDMHLEFKLASRYQARELFKRFYMPNSELEKEDGHSFGSEKRDKGDSRPNDTVSDTKTNGSDGVSYREGHAGRHSMRALSPDELEKLAEDFGDAIPVGEFSMASLQGYLMGYKVNPETAVREAASWVTKEREGRDGVMALSHTRGSRPAARRTRKLRRIKGVN